jgi:hypothetical protein
MVTLDRIRLTGLLKENPAIRRVFPFQGLPLREMDASPVHHEISDRVSGVLLTEHFVRGEAFGRAKARRRLVRALAEMAMADSSRDIDANGVLGEAVDAWRCWASRGDDVKGSRKAHHFRQSKSAPSGGG